MPAKRNSPNKSRGDSSGWQSLVDSYAATTNPETGMGYSIGQAWYDSVKDKLGVSADVVAKYAASKGYNLGNQWANYGKTEWQSIVDRQAQQGTIGQAWFDATGSSLGVSAEEIYGYAKSKGYTLGEAWGGPSQEPPAPAFDWDAWNAQMARQQQAMWESYDAMNASFLEQAASRNEEGLRRRQSGSAATTPAGYSPDEVQVRRKKRNPSATTNTINNPNMPRRGVQTVSLGGSAANGLAIGKG